MINPMMIIQAMQRGGNPMALMQQLMGQNPQIAQVMQKKKKKSPEQLKQMATNMAKERGTTPEQILNQFKGM